MDPDGPARITKWLGHGARRVNLYRVTVAAASFRVDAAPAGSTLATETWVKTRGLRARILFGVYWTVIGPFSGLIRRTFLRVAKRRAERR